MGKLLTAADSCRKWRQPTTFPRNSAFIDRQTRLTHVIAMNRKNTLQHLPSELLQSIAAFIASQRDLAALACANRRLNLILSPLLYARDAPYALMWAAAHGPAGTVRRALLAKANPRTKGELQRTPLQEAAAHGNPDVVRALLATGVDANSVDDMFGRSCLSWAADGGSEACVRLFLAVEGINVNSLDNQLRTPLARACFKGHVAAAALLLATPGVLANGRDKEGKTPLKLAMMQGHHGVVRLLAAHAGVFINDEEGEAPVFTAIYAGRGILEVFLQADGLDLDVRNTEGQTPLCYAAKYGRGGEVGLLLATGKVDISARCLAGQTALHYAAKYGREDEIAMLMAAGADARAEDNMHRTPLDIVTRGRQPASMDSTVSLLKV